jgi:hypothetical protein
MAGNDRDSPEHWRERAKKARAHAEEMTDFVARGMMRDVADIYDKVAERAERKLRE